MSVIDKFRMQGQVAIVTGAAAGIGRGIAEALAGAGAAVVVSDLEFAKAEAVAKAIRDAGGRAAGVLVGGLAAVITVLVEVRTKQAMLRPG